MRFDFKAYQFFSRGNISLGESWAIQSSVGNPITFTTNFQLVARPFSISCAGLVGKNPCIGAAEFFDKELDEYLEDRWPTCLMATGSVESDDDWNVGSIGLSFARSLLWMGRGPTLQVPLDQLATVLGYRRWFARRSATDILGQRRPHPTNHFEQSGMRDPIGPGIVNLLNDDTPGNADELVWSEIIKCPNRTTVENDKKFLETVIAARRRHYNSHSELRDSEKYITLGDHKGAVRSAASAVEASLLQCMEMRGVRLPKGHRFDSFERKIEATLKLAGLPPFTKLESVHALNIAYLYRARNKMHEADCYYKDSNGRMIKVRHVDQITDLVSSAKAFVLWMDSML